MKEGERERGKLQKHRRSLQYATKTYSPSKVAKEWRNIPFKGLFSGVKIIGAKLNRLINTSPNYD